jgi:hypothetical protein
VATTITGEEDELTGSEKVFLPIFSCDEVKIASATSPWEMLPSNSENSHQVEST